MDGRSFKFEVLVVRTARDDRDTYKFARPVRDAGYIKEFERGGFTCRYREESDSRASEDSIV